MMVKEEAERIQQANRHHRCHLLVKKKKQYKVLQNPLQSEDSCTDTLRLLPLQSVGLQGLALNVIWNKTHRLNNNMAAQHHHQTVASSHPKL